MLDELHTPHQKKWACWSLVRDINWTWLDFYLNYKEKHLWCPRSQRDGVRDDGTWEGGPLLASYGDYNGKKR